MSRTLPPPFFEALGVVGTEKFLSLRSGRSLPRGDVRRAWQPRRGGRRASTRAPDSAAKSFAKSKLFLRGFALVRKWTRRNYPSRGSSGNSAVDLWRRSRAPDPDGFAHVSPSDWSGGARRPAGRRDGGRRWCRRRRRTAPSTEAPPASPRRRRPGRPGWSPRSRPGGGPDRRPAARGRRTRAQVARVGEQLLEERSALRPADPHGLQRCADGRRHRGRGEHERPRRDLQELDDVGGPRDEAAAGGEALGEGAHAKVDPVGDPEQLAGACAGRAEDSDRMGLVNHQPDPIALGQLEHVGKRAEVALHREDAVNHDQDPAAVV